MQKTIFNITYLHGDDGVNKCISDNSEVTSMCRIWAVI